jgi:hypothetical protein
MFESRFLTCGTPLTHQADEMPKRQTAQSRVTAGEALYIVEQLIASRRVSDREVTAILAKMHQEIEGLEQRLATLRQVAGTARNGRPSTNRRVVPYDGPAGRVHRTLTPELAKSRRLQGEYMGLIRHLSGPVRAKMRKLASEEGREAAIKSMRSASGA